MTLWVQYTLNKENGRAGSTSEFLQPDSKCNYLNKGRHLT